MQDIWKWRLTFRWEFRLPRKRHLILQQSFWTEMVKLSISSSWDIPISTNVFSSEIVKLSLFLKGWLSFLEQHLVHARWNQLLPGFSGVSSLNLVLTLAAEGGSPALQDMGVRSCGNQLLWTSQRWGAALELHLLKVHLGRFFFNIEDPQKLNLPLGSMGTQNPCYADSPWFEQGFPLISDSHFCSREPTQPFL